MNVRVTVNGAERTVPAGTDVAAMVTDVAGTAAGTAVAVNGDVLPRARWAGTALRDGDAVEVLTAVQGG
jgi:sulfur carrier protein